MEYFYKGVPAKVLSKSNSGASIWISVPLLNGETVGLNVYPYQLEVHPMFKSSRNGETQ